MDNIAFTNSEFEVIILKAIIEIIDSIINHEVLEILGPNDSTTIMFPTHTHQKYFNIILLDFLSNMDEQLSGQKKSGFELLKDICKNPRFNKYDSINFLYKSIIEMENWLKKEVEIESWFPSINQDIILKIYRYEFVKICGNISKHNFTRLTIVSKEIIKIFNRNNVNIKHSESLLLLDEFYDRFHDDILNNHGSILAEMLNNIRWGIYYYLLPEYKQSLIRYPDDPLRYSYKYPNDINTNFSKACFWELMNYIRNTPYIEKFKAAEYLKKRY